MGKLREVVVSGENPPPRAMIVKLSGSYESEIHESSQGS